MKFSVVPFAITILFVLLAGRWTVASETSDPSLQDDTCAHVCEDTASIEELFPSTKVLVVKVEAVNQNQKKGFVGIFGRLVNRFFNLFRRHQENKPRFEISTDLFLPSLTSASIKAKSLATLIRSESETYAATSDTPDVIATLFDLSAENMESVAAVVDPIVDEMRQHETMDLQSVVSMINPLLSHIRDTALPNIVSILTFILTKSGNEEMEAMYDNYDTSKVDKSSDTWLKETSDSEQCVAQGYSNYLSKTSISESQTPIQTTLESLGCYVFRVVGSFLLIVGLIILFPLSFIVSILTSIILIFLFISSKIFDTAPIIPPVDDNCYLACGLEGAIYVLLYIALVASPILVPIGIFVAILNLFYTILSPLLKLFQPPTPPTPAPTPFSVYTPFNPISPPYFFPNVAPSNFPNTASPTSAPNATAIKLPSTGRDVQQANKVTHRLLDVLNSPMDTIMKLFKSKRGFPGRDEDDEEETVCEMTELKCKNEALIEALPF
jgi:hypothetical protein